MSFKWRAHPALRRGINATLSSSAPLWLLLTGACATTPAPGRTSAPCVQDNQNSAPASPVKREEKPAPSTKPTPSTGDCKIRHAQDFDFWIGRWEVRSADGKLVGYNHIHPILDGCSLQENYKTVDGAYVGKSLNRYDPASQSWHQVWVDNGGLWLSLEGGVTQGAMVMRGNYLQRRDAQGKVLETPRPTLQEIRWVLLPDQRVQQSWRSSSDGGKTWTMLFDGFYTRIKTIP